VVIDGDLGDWDLSGEIYSYISEPTKEIMNAYTALMYDRDALYIAARIADPTPMLNRWDPAVNPDFGWDGDSFQLRLSLNPQLGYPVNIGWGQGDMASDNVVHMTLWYYTDAKTPVLHMKYGMNFHDAPDYPKGIVPRDKYQGAYQAWKDGKGYTLEYRIPWTTLRAARAPMGGDLAAGALQVQWSNADGTHLGPGNVVDLQRTAGFSYQHTGCWGKIIYAKTGHLPKEMTQDAPTVVRRLPATFTTTLPKAQVVSVALFNANGDLVRHILAAQSRPAGALREAWDGQDDAGRVLPAGAYTWKAVTHEPFSVKYLLSVNNAGTPGYPTPDGAGAWGGDWGNPVAICFAGDRGLISWSGSEAGPGLIAVDANAKKIWGGRYSVTSVASDGEWVYAYLNGEKQIRAYAIADCKQLNFLRGELWVEHNAGKETHCTGMTYADSKLYVADGVANTITEYHARQGVILRTLKVNAVLGMTAVDAHTLAVVSNDAVQRLDLISGAATPWITDHLDHPYGIARAANGDLFVSNRGALMNVSVYNARGQYLRSIGLRGGRALPAGSFASTGNASPARRGKWAPMAMLNPAGLAVDGKGRLWVTEDDFQPKRISIWEARTGKLLDEKFGPAYVSTPVTMDPTDPTRVYCNNVEWKVDLQKDTWTAGAVMIDARRDAPYFWPHMVLNIVFTARNGKQYMHAKWSDGQYLFVRRGDHFEAVAGLISPTAAFTWRQGAKDWQEMGKIGWVLWEDVNGDGLVQQAETRHTKMQPAQMHSCFTDDLTMYAAGMYGALYWQRLSPAKILKNGVPHYDDATFTQVDYVTKADVPTYTSDLTVNPTDGSVLMYAGADIKYMDKSEIWPLQYWTKEGKVIWRFRNGCRWYDMYEFPIARPDQYWGCTKNIGIIDGITGYSSYFGFIHMLTTDGVALGTLMQDGRSGAPSGPDRINCEWFTGQLVKLHDGRWLLLGGDQDGRVLQVFGLDTLVRSQGVLTISEAEVKAAADARTEWLANQARAQSLVISRTFDAPDWVNFKGINIAVDEKRGFAAKAAYDTKNLYVYLNVNAPNALINSIQEDQLVFKGGNALDIQMATDPLADAQRTTPAPGDLRVLITRRNDKPFAVVYRYKVAGFTGQPTLFTSPTGQERVDRIDTWDDVALSYEKTATGFTAVVTLPLTRLGWTPNPAGTVKMDIGYLFGNETGNNIVVRKYWSNTSFSSGVTNDVPNESRIEPAHWGTAFVE